MNIENAMLNDQELDNISGGASAASAGNSTPKYQVGQTVVIQSEGNQYPGVVLDINKKGTYGDYSSWLFPMAQSTDADYFIYTVQLQRAMTGGRPSRVRVPESALSEA